MADDDKTEALERRVAELEQRLGERQEEQGEDDEQPEEHRRPALHDRPSVQHGSSRLSRGLATLFQADGSGRGPAAQSQPERRNARCSSRQTTTMSSSAPG